MTLIIKDCDGRRNIICLHDTPPVYRSDVSYCSLLPVLPGTAVSRQQPLVACPLHSRICTFCIPLKQTVLFSNRPFGEARFFTACFSVFRLEKNRISNLQNFFHIGWCTLPVSRADDIHTPFFHIIGDNIPLLHESDRASSGGLRRYMADCGSPCCP